MEILERSDEIETDYWYYIEAVNRETLSIEYNELLGSKDFSEQLTLLFAQKLDDELRREFAELEEATEILNNPDIEASKEREILLDEKLIEYFGNSENAEQMEKMIEQIEILEDVEGVDNLLQEFLSELSKLFWVFTDFATFLELRLNTEANKLNLAELLVALELWIEIELYPKSLEVEFGNTNEILDQYNEIGRQLQELSRSWKEQGEQVIKELKEESGSEIVDKWDFSAELQEIEEIIDNNYLEKTANIIEQVARERDELDVEKSEELEEELLQQEERLQEEYAEKLRDLELKMKDEVNRIELESETEITRIEQIADMKYADMSEQLKEIEDDKQELQDELESVIEQLKQNIVELNEENQAYINERDAFLQTIEDLKDEQIVLNEQIALNNESLTQAKLDYEREVEELEREYERIVEEKYEEALEEGEETGLNESLVQIEQMDETIRQLREQIAELERSESDNRDEILNLRQNIDNMENEKEEMIRFETSELNQQIAEKDALKMQTELLISQIGGLRDTIEQFEAEKSRLEQEFIEENEQFVDQLSELKEEYQEMREQYDNNEIALEQAKLDLEAEKRLNEANQKVVSSQLENLREQNGEYIAKISEYEKELLNLQNNYDQLAKLLAERETIIVNMNGEIESNREEINEFQINVLELREQQVEMEREIETEESRLEIQMQNLAEKEEEINQLEQEMLEIEEIGGPMSEEESERIAELEDILKGTSEERDAEIMEKQRLELEVRELKEENKALEDSLGNLEQQYQEALSENAKLTSSAVFMQNEIEENQIIISRLKNELESEQQLETKIANEKQSINELELQVSEKREELRESREMLDALSFEYEADRNKHAQYQQLLVESTSLFAQILQIRRVDSPENEETLVSELVPVYESTIKEIESVLQSLGASEEELDAWEELNIAVNEYMQDATKSQEVLTAMQNEHLDSMAELEEQIVQLQSEISSYLSQQRQLEELGNLAYDLKNELEIMTKNYQETLTFVDQEESSIKELNEQLLDVQVALKQQQDQTERIQIDMEIQEQEYQDLENMYKRQEALIEELENNIQANEEKIKELETASIQSISNDEEHQNREMYEYETENSVLRQLLEQANEKVNAQTNEILQLRQALEEFARSQNLDDEKFNDLMTRIEVMYDQSLSYFAKKNPFSSTLNDMRMSFEDIVREIILLTQSTMSNADQNALKELLSQKKMEIEIFLSVIKALRNNKTNIVSGLEEAINFMEQFASYSVSRFLLEKEDDELVRVVNEAGQEEEEDDADNDEDEMEVEAQDDENDRLLSQPNLGMAEQRRLLQTQNLLGVESQFAADTVEIQLQPILFEIRRPVINIGNIRPPQRPIEPRMNFIDLVGMGDENIVISKIDTSLIYRGDDDILEIRERFRREAVDSKAEADMIENSLNEIITIPNLDRLPPPDENPQFPRRDDPNLINAQSRPSGEKVVTSFLDDPQNKRTRSNILDIISDVDRRRTMPANQPGTMDIEPPGESLSRGIALTRRSTTGPVLPVAQTTTRVTELNFSMDEACALLASISRSKEWVRYPEIKQLEKICQLLLKIRQIEMETIVSHVGLTGMRQVKWSPTERAYINELQKIASMVKELGDLSVRLNKTNSSFV